MRDSFRKFGAISLFITPILFFILSTIAMILYPGGYGIDEMIFYPNHYKFDKNFLSDLGMLKTATGWDNLPSSILFCLGMTLVGIAFIIHAISLPSYFPKNTKQKKYAFLSVIFAVISSLGFIGVAFTPWDVFPIAHNVSVLIGFGISMFYCLYFGLAVLKEKSYPNIYGYLSMGYILLIIVYALLSVFAPPYESFPGRTTHVVAQKVVAYVIMILLPTQAFGSLILLKKRKDLMNYEQ